MKAVIFDFNGTLFFDNDKHVLAWNKMSQLIRNKTITDEELHHQFNGVPNTKIIQYMTNNTATKEEIEKYSNLKESFYREFCKEDTKSFHLVSGVTEFFDSLKQKNIPFTIASASIKVNIDFFVESFHLNQWIKTEDIVYDNGTYENKISMFKKAAKILNVNIEDTLVFEDSFSGISNAYKAGVRNIIVVCPKDKEDEYNKLPGVIGTIQDFKNVNKFL